MGIVVVKHPSTFCAPEQQEPWPFFVCGNFSSKRETDRGGSPKVRKKPRTGKIKMDKKHGYCFF